MKTESPRNEREKRRRLKAAAKGLCTKCQIRKPIKGFRQCDYCHRRNAGKRAILRAQGICTRCRKRPWAEGKKVCAECRSYLASQPREKIRERGYRRWKMISRTCRAAKNYVHALRELEIAVNAPLAVEFEVRKKVQSATRELFAAVERKSA